MTYLSRLLAAAVVFALYSANAYAAPTEADRAIAVRLVVEGRARFDAAQYSAALELFKRAHEIMRAPTTGLDLAQAHGALGQLVEARRVVEEVVHIPVEPNEKPVFAEARANAKLAIEALDSRIPLLKLHVIGPPLNVAQVTIDGKTLTPDEAAKPYPGDPGKHTVTVTAPDYHPAEVTITLAEYADPLSVDVTLKPMERPVPPPPPPPLVIKPSGVPPLAIAGFAVSGGLLVTSAITGVVANVANRNAADAALDKGCAPGPGCEAVFSEQYGRSTTFSVVAIASLGVGVGVGAASLIYALKAPKAPDPTKAPKMSWIALPTPGGIVVQGAW